MKGKEKLTDETGRKKGWERAEIRFFFEDTVYLASTGDKFTQTRFPSEVRPRIFTCAHVDTNGEHTLAPTHEYFLSSHLYIKQERLQRK